ncbi:PP2C family protein-serine/threonine phosphatase [Allobranchiibius sp. GilTou38]|uniref:PP2C family protein-serine/threonine phosphatase n=1 Tax=Allobranchiibius sp. GilTou38 TaxID=2815210 RepID=UPI001AA0B8A2|nr:PP2C family protein-serine/threonine phosphatase [Allobranchiibius sp. GilTou38]MBO1768044.1 serine/threonine-protein phosphatase [Allobranchiibius sp. GilTou38]
MAVHVHFTPRDATREDGVRRPRVRAAIIAALCIIVVLTVLSARFDGLLAAVLVLAAGGGALGLGVSSVRESPWLSHAVSSTLLHELHERVRVQGRMPELPAGWRVESVTRAADGDRFSGDFVIGNRTDQHRFEVALVDVSGSGHEAGSRSMLMGGAVSGLLGPVAPQDFLPAANDYLVRQNWSEGFATAIHVCVDLADGSFSVGSAGHPAAVQFHAATNLWTTVDGATGTCLGVLEGQNARDYPRVEGVLEHGDALLLYTDGIVETRDLDLSEGLAQVLDTIRALPTSVGSAGRVCEAARSGQGDDRTAVMLCRD